MVNSTFEALVEKKSQRSLEELLGGYFDAGVQEGREGRDHDTAEGIAQATLMAIQLHIQGLIRAERENSAKLLDLTSSDLQLLGGEMSAQELRTLHAVLANRRSVILSGERAPEKKRKTD